MEDMFKQSIQYLYCNAINRRYYTNANLCHLLLQEIPTFYFSSYGKCFTTLLNPPMYPWSIFWSHRLLEKVSFKLYVNQKESKSRFEELTALGGLKNQLTTKTLLFGKITLEIDCRMLNYATLPLLFFIKYTVTICDLALYSNRIKVFLSSLYIKLFSSF